MSRNFEFSTRRARERAEDEALIEDRFCGVAAAVVGGMAVGGMMSGGSSGPDTSGMNQAAQQEAALSKEQLDWSKQIYADTAKDRADAVALAKEQGQLQNQAARTQIDAATDTLAYQKDTFRPVEQKLASDALNYDTPARREAEAAAARADVEREVSGQRDATTRTMERAGVAPNSGRVMAMQGTMDLGAAKLKAGAANTARRTVEATGVARMGDVANLGRNIASSQVAQLQSGVQAGNAATANGQVPVNVAAAGNGIMQQGFAGAQTALAGAGSLYGSMASVQNQASQANNAIWGAAGNVAGAYMSRGALMTSDKNEKEEIEPVDDDDALAAVRATPVEAWKYKDGVEDGDRHVGPMAQTVAASMGMDAAPGGKKVDLVSLNGINMSAIRALDRRISKVAAAAGIEA